MPVSHLLFWCLILPIVWIEKMDNERDREIGMVIKKVNKYVLNPRGMCSFNYMELGGRRGHILLV